MPRYSVKKLLKEGIELSEKYGYWSDEVKKFNDKLTRVCKNMETIYNINFIMREKTGNNCWNRLKNIRN